ncbi:P-loop containing nucleoside triphosphate hydrolase protein [Jackrogersella minutella]|nr:P-loop containing nucleoside triphosphate hydrolase protein [Jackrogersella minutella]
MPRQIDTIPQPNHIKPKKLIVLSASRTGTFALYRALKQLGFKPLHMVEVLESGLTEFNILNDAIKAEMFHDGKPYGRAEFDKWWADYDVIIEVPFYMLHSTVKAYPDAKFLLTERDPEKWAKSFAHTVGWVVKRFSTFPLSIFKHFDSMAYNIAFLVETSLSYYSNGYGLSPIGQKCITENYIEYIAEVKRIVPPEQLKVCKLEDGFGWSEICPYLGVPIPDIEWPSRHTPEEFQATTDLSLGHMQYAVTKRLVGTVSVVLPIVAVGLWYMKAGRLFF